MKLVRSILKIGRARYMLMPQGMFPDSDKVLLDIQYMKNDTSVSMRIYPYHGKPEENGGEEETVTVKVSKKILEGKEEVGHNRLRQKSR
jgi:hypothetical protein